MAGHDKSNQMRFIVYYQAALIIGASIAVLYFLFAKGSLFGAVGTLVLFFPLVYRGQLQRQFYEGSISRGRVHAIFWLMMAAAAGVVLLLNLIL